MTSGLHRGGTGSPLVLLHGIASSWRAWRPVLDELERHHEVYAITLPGHLGGPQWPGHGPSTADGMVDVLCARLDELGLDAPHLVGNSLGGWLALELARRGRAGSVTALSPAGAWRSRRELYRLLAVLWIGTTIARLPPVRRMVRVPFLRRVLLGAHADRYRRDEVEVLFSDVAGCTALRPLLARLRRDGPIRPLDPLPCPVLVAWGADDRRIPFRGYGRPLMDAVPAADLVVLPGVGHVPMVDDPVLVADVVLRVTGGRADRHHPEKGSPPMNHVGDVSHASAALAAFGERHWAAKSSQDVDGFLACFSEQTLYYGDATLGRLHRTPASFRASIEAMMPRWGDGRSYGLRMLGGERSAVVLVRDTPELFGAEIVALCAGDWDDDGRIVRWVDYWDSRPFGVQRAAAISVAADEFPPGFGEERVESRATADITGVVQALADALAGAHPQRAAEWFTAEATFEDMTARTRIRGAAAIGRYLQRAAARAPWGRGSRVRRVLGNELGGGYEWVNADHLAARGISAVELTADGRISDLVTVWDGGLVTPADLAELAALALEE